MKLELLTNATVVDDAIRFVSKSTQNLKSSSNNSDGESNQHDYEEQLEKDQEEKTEEITTVTTNQVF